MPVYWPGLWDAPASDDAPQFIPAGRPKRDRKKIAAGRRAARRNRG